MKIFTQTVYQSPLGLLEISCDGDMITALHFSEQQVVPDVPGITKENLPAILKTCCRELDAYFQGELRTFRVAVKQEGTAFQQKVWTELTKIPFGQTISYLDLSKRIGDPKAIRAVGTTNGKNQVGIIVPCHRVVGTDGSLTGYAGGLWRKQWLLAHEMKVLHGVRTLF